VNRKKPPALVGKGRNDLKKVDRRKLQQPIGWWLSLTFWLTLIFLGDFSKLPIDLQGEDVIHTTLEADPVFDIKNKFV